MIKLILSLAVVAGPVAAAPIETKFVSLQANKVINEVRTPETFHFEQCDFFHLDGSSVAEELAARAFVNCRPLGAAQPLAARPVVEQHLNLALGDRRRDLSDPSVARWAANGFVQGALFGGLVRVGARRVFVRQAYPTDQAIKDFIRWGSFFGVVTSWAQARRAIAVQGAHHATLGLIDAEMPTGTYILDQRSNDRTAQTRAFDAIAGVIDRVMAEFKF